MRALEAVSAGAAEGERRIAAAVEEQQRLLAALERLADRGDADGGDIQRPRSGKSGA